MLQNVKTKSVIPFSRKEISNEDRVKAFINFGSELLKIKKTLKHGKWVEYLKITYGDKDIRNCQNALYLAQRIDQINPELFNLGIDKLLKTLRDKKFNRKSTDPVKLEEESIKFINKQINKINPNKKFVEKFFLDICKMYMSDVSCLSITGPNYNRHITRLFKTIAKKVFVMEINSDYCRSIWSQALKCNYFKDGLVNIIHGDAKDILINDCHYIDLDLMQTFKNTKDIIERHLEHQSKLPGIKAFTFTSSNRKNGGEEKIFREIKDLLKRFTDSELIGFNNRIGKFGGKRDGISMKVSSGAFAAGCKGCKKHIPMFTKMGRLLDFHWFNYGDGTPMMTMLMIYK